MSDGPFVDGPPGGPDAWREVWQEDRRFRPRPSRWDFFLRIFRRLVNRSVEAEGERQRNDVRWRRRHHRAELALTQQFHRFAAEACGQHPIDITGPRPDFDTPTACSKNGPARKK